MVFCLERGADLHMALLMPLPLAVFCFSKIQIGFTFLVPAHPGGPGKGPLNARVCVLAIFDFLSVQHFITYIVICHQATTRCVILYRICINVFTQPAGSLRVCTTFS